RRINNIAKKNPGAFVSTGAKQQLGMTQRTMTHSAKKINFDNDNKVNISRVRRAIDFARDEFTNTERLVAGVIADHFNAEEGYAFPSYRYLESVYGFRMDMIAKTVAKLKNGWMLIDKSSGNNQYVPNMRKVESVLARLEESRKEWKEGASGR